MRHLRVHARGIGHGTGLAKGRDSDDVVNARVALGHDLDGSARVPLARVLLARPTPSTQLTAEDAPRNLAVSSIQLATLVQREQAQRHLLQIIGLLLGPELGHSPSRGNGLGGQFDLVLVPQTRGSDKVIESAGGSKY